MSYPKSSLTDLTVALNPSSYRILSGYLVTLFVIGALLSALPLVLYWQERDRFEIAYQQQADYLKTKYAIVPSEAQAYTCYLNVIHYRNQSFLHELLPVLPYVECTEAVFKADIAKLQSTYSPFHWALLFPGIALMVLSLIGWLGLVELNKQKGGA
jgi:hypothetical protein